MKYYSLSVFMALAGWVVTTEAAATVTITNSGTLAVGLPLTNWPSGCVLALDGETITWTGANCTNVDKSGLGNHAGFIGASLTNSFAPGPRGQALSFPTTSDYLQCGSAAALDDMTNGMSIAWWMYCPSNGSAGYLFSKGTGAGRWQFYYSSWSTILYAAPGYRLNFIRDFSTTDLSVQFGQAHQDDGWHHYAFIWSGGPTTNDTRMYVDGMPVWNTFTTAGVGSIVSDAANNLTIGGYPGDGTFKGLIKDVVVTTNQMTHEDVLGLYRRRATGLGYVPWVRTNYVATNLLWVDGPDFVVGTNLNIALLTNATKGLQESAVGPWAFTAGSGSNLWRVVSLGSNFTFLNPITVNGVTYAGASNAISYDLSAGTACGWSLGIPQTWGSATFQAYFRSDIGYKSGYSGGHDVLDVGANQNDAVIQVIEDYRQRWASHTVNEGASINGQRIHSNQAWWHRLTLSWNTNTGIAQAWIEACDDYPLAEKRGAILHTSWSTMRANSNCTYVSIFDNTHGLSQLGKTNYWVGAALFQGTADLIDPKFQPKSP